MTLPTEAPVEAEVEDDDEFTHIWCVPCARAQYLERQTQRSVCGLDLDGSGQAGPEKAVDCQMCLDLWSTHKEALHK